MFSKHFRDYRRPNRTLPFSKIKQNMNLNIHKNSCLFNSNANIATRKVTWRDPWTLAILEESSIASIAKLPTYIGYELYLSCIHQITGSINNKEQLLARLDAYNFDRPLETGLRSLLDLTNYNIFSSDFRRRGFEELEALVNSEVLFTRAKNITTTPGGVLQETTKSRIVPKKIFRFLSKLEYEKGIAKIWIHKDAKTLFKSSRINVNPYAYAEALNETRSKNQILAFLAYLNSRFLQTNNYPFEVLLSDLINNLNLSNYNGFLLSRSNGKRLSALDRKALKVKMSLGKKEFFTFVIPKAVELFKMVHNLEFAFEIVAHKRTFHLAKDPILSFSINELRKIKKIKILDQTFTKSVKKFPATEDSPELEPEGVKPPKVARSVLTKTWRSKDSAV